MRTRSRFGGGRRRPRHALVGILARLLHLALRALLGHRALLGFLGGALDLGLRLGQLLLALANLASADSVASRFARSSLLAQALVGLGAHALRLGQLLLRTRHPVGGGRGAARSPSVADRGSR